MNENNGCPEEMVIHSGEKCGAICCANNAHVSKIVIAPAMDWRLCICIYENDSMATADCTSVADCY